MVRSRRPLRLAAALATVALAVLVVGCSSDGGDPEADGGPVAGRAAAEQAKEEGRTVIDVRTAEEFEAGHIEGARRVGLADDDFGDRVEALDAEGDYVVYCRTGARSAEAAKLMAEAGLDVLDGGAMADMVDAGWPATGTTP